MPWGIFGSLGDLGVRWEGCPWTPRDTGVGQGGHSAGQNESLVRATGKAHSPAFSSSRKIAFLPIFCTVSFFIFKNTFIGSRRRKPCTVLETEKGFLGHLSQDLRIFFVSSRQGKGSLQIWNWHPSSKCARILGTSVSSLSPGWDMGSSSASKERVLWPKQKHCSFSLPQFTLL